MFSYTYFFSHLFVTFAFIFLGLSIVSMWANKKIYLWGTLLVISFLLAWYGNIVSVLALIPIGVLLVCHYGISLDLSGWSRYFLVMIAAVVSFGLNWHLVKGFANPLIGKQMLFSQNAVPLNWYLNFDKPFVGIFVLGFYLPLIDSPKKFIRMLFQAVPWTAGSAILLLGVSTFTGIITWDIKWFGFFWLFFLINLIFVVIPEEVFYRGFLQREIMINLKNRAAGLLAVLVVSLLFATSHLLFVPSIGFFLSALVASLAYGGIYLLTGTIESSIFTHFCINVIHIVFFTYPALHSSLTRFSS